LAPLARLAYNYWWSWAPGGHELFQSIDPLRWQHSGQNPVRLLQEVRRARLAELASDSAFVARVHALDSRLTAYLASPPDVATEDAPPIAHMSAEFGIHASLPVYAGGLGVLMGDFLKEVSDQATPALGIGLLYWQGSFHQRTDASGWQHEYWTDTDPERLPAALVSNHRGPLTVEVPARGRSVVAQIWRVDVGRVPLFLLDTNRANNTIADRWITSRLYIGDKEIRLAQYAVLGIGGIRAMRAMGIAPSIVHLNEGHAALAAIELVREGIAEGLDIESAMEAARRQTTFTTHTPVPAGHDTFSREEVTSCLAELPGTLRLDWDAFIAMGRARPQDQSEPFGTTPLALRLSHDANAVSRVHGDISRSMWHAMWPDSRVEDVPIGHVTNGVHVPTWTAPEMQDLLDRYLPRDWRRRASEPEVWAAIDDIPDEELWEVRCLLRQRLVRFVRERSVLDRLGRGEAVSYAEAASELWDDDVITLGFVRRIATYKRLYLLTSDPDRGLRLLAGPKPVQLAIAGKAHPQDDEAKRTVQRVFALNRMADAAGRVVFLEDLDLAMEPYLVQGCDVWLNLPRPPNEASGTSGMKSVFNGGLQLSVLDGWWAEAYDGSNGWAIETPQNAGWDEQDAHDAEAVFRLLESEAIPLFYDRAAPGELPRAWVKKIKASMKSLAPQFNATRMVKEYAARQPARSP
jgi:starch phosphorylase